MVSGECCPYISIEFTVREIIGRKDVVTIDVFHADNELYLLLDQLCKGIRAF